MSKDYADEYIELLKQKIKDLELEISDLKYKPFKDHSNQLGGSSVTLTTPLNLLCDHVYPFPWFGIFPPACMKCGAQTSPQVTCSSDAIPG